MDFLFGRGGKFYEFATKLYQLMGLNLLTLVCCLPVFTAGSALTAMHYVLVQIYRDEEMKVWKSYFKSFRENFLRATVIWVIYLLYFGFLTLEYLIMHSLQNDTLRYLNILLPVLGLIGVLSMQWAFVLLSRYKLSVKETFLFAFTRIIAFPVRSFFMAVALLLPLVISYFFPHLFILVPLFGFSVPGVLQTCFYNYALKVMEDTGEEADTEEKTEEV